MLLFQLKSTLTCIGHLKGMDYLHQNQSGGSEFIPQNSFTSVHGHSAANVLDMYVRSCIFSWKIMVTIMFTVEMMYGPSEFRIYLT